ncbi:MAG: dockerin type I repeat-containing protein [Clostridia bacterium]|nr:dockerin type I repeat-containing protein [Clostridia bacterium]
MKKTLKKLTAVLLSSALLLSVGIPAQAGSYDPPNWFILTNSFMPQNVLVRYNGTYACDSFGTNAVANFTVSWDAQQPLPTVARQEWYYLENGQYRPALPEMMWDDNGNITYDPDAVQLPENTTLDDVYFLDTDSEYKPVSSTVTDTESPEEMELYPVSPVTGEAYMHYAYDGAHGYPRYLPGPTEVLEEADSDHVTKYKTNPASTDTETFMTDTDARYASNMFTSMKYPLNVATEDFPGWGYYADHRRNYLNVDIAVADEQHPQRLNEQSQLTGLIEGHTFIMGITAFVGVGGQWGETRMVQIPVTFNSKNVGEVFTVKGYNMSAAWDKAQKSRPATVTLDSIEDGSIINCNGETVEGKVTALTVKTGKDAGISKYSITPVRSVTKNGIRNTSGTIISGREPVFVAGNLDWRVPFAQRQKYNGEFYSKAYFDENQSLTGTLRSVEYSQAPTKTAMPTFAAAIDDLDPTATEDTATDTAPDTEQTDTEQTNNTDTGHDTDIDPENTDNTYSTDSEEDKPAEVIVGKDVYIIYEHPETANGEALIEDPDYIYQTIKVCMPNDTSANNNAGYKEGEHITIALNALSYDETEKGSEIYIDVPFDASAVGNTYTVDDVIDDGSDDTDTTDTYDIPTDTDTTDTTDIPTDTDSTDINDTPNNTDTDSGSDTDSTATNDNPDNTETDSTYNTDNTDTTETDTSGNTDTAGTDTSDNTDNTDTTETDTSDNTDNTDTAGTDTSDNTDNTDNTETDNTDTPDTADDTESDTEDNFMLGDVDGDGKVSAKDSMLVQRYVINLKQLSDLQKKAADIDLDGKITNKDALGILRFSIGFHVKNLS